MAGVDTNIAPMSNRATHPAMRPPVKSSPYRIISATMNSYTKATAVIRSQAAMSTAIPNGFL